MGWLNSTTTLRSKANNGGHSLNCWHDCPVDRMLDAGLGAYFFEDFRAFRGTVDTNVGRYSGESGGWTSFEDTSAAITSDVAAQEGVLKLTTPATDNKEIWLQPGSATSVLAKFLNSSSQLQQIWCEIRLKLSSAANTSFGMFAGLGAPALAAENTIADAGTLVDTNLVGFFRPEGDGDGLDFVYQKTGGGVQTVQADMVVAADTFYNLAFKTEPRNSDGARLVCFKDNVEQAGYVDLRSVPSTFPSTALLNFLLGLKNAAGTAYTLSIDWVALGVIFSRT